VRAVVTGAAGFIGSHLAETLVAAAQDVVPIDCFTDYYDPRVKEKNAGTLDVVRADLAVDPIDDLLVGAEAVFHAAAQPGVRRSWGESFGVYVRNNLLASQRLFEAAAKAGTRVVLSSSSSIYGEAFAYPTSEDAVPRPISPYGVTKLGVEHLARAYARGSGLDVVTLRYFTVYGPRQRPDMAFAQISRALAEKTAFEVYGDGLQSRDFTYVGDVVAASLRAAELAPSGAVYNVGGGSEATMQEAIGICENLAGRSLDVQYLPAAAGDVRRTVADTSRIRSDLDWQPKMSLATGLKAQLEWAFGRIGGQ
jgi:nucleoside-diphosphate-sugar epimerase